MVVKDAEGLVPDLNLDAKAHPCEMDAVLNGDSDLRKDTADANGEAPAPASCAQRQNESEPGDDFCSLEEPGVEPMEVGGKTSEDVEPVNRATEQMEVDPGATLGGSAEDGVSATESEKESAEKADDTTEEEMNTVSDTENNGPSEEEETEKAGSKPTEAIAEESLHIDEDTLNLGSSQIDELLKEAQNLASKNAEEDESPVISDVISLKDNEAFSAPPEISAIEDASKTTTEENSSQGDNEEGVGGEDEQNKSPEPRNEETAAKSSEVDDSVAVASPLVELDVADTIHEESSTAEEDVKPLLKLVPMSVLTGEVTEVKEEPVEAMGGVSIESQVDDTEIKTELCDVGIGAGEGDFLRTVKVETPVGMEAAELRKRRAEDNGTGEGSKKARLEEKRPARKKTGEDGARSGVVDSEDEDADDPAPMPDGDESTGSSSARPSPAPSPGPELSNSESEGPLSRLAPEESAVIPALRALRRGSLAHLSRSDLEELLVQKLCESLCERSQVGEIRRRTEALEEEVEKWRERALAGAKQIRELDLVLQKFVSETQRQTVEGKGHIVTPIRVTRSVGLQVAIGSGASKKLVNNPAWRKSPQKPPNTPDTKPAPSSFITTPTGNKIIPARTPIKSPASAVPPVTMRPKTVTTAPANKNKVQPLLPMPVRTIPVQAVNKKQPAATTFSTGTGSSVIDLSDSEEERPGNDVPAPTQKMAYLLKSKGVPHKIILASPPSTALRVVPPMGVRVPPPPQLVFKGNSIQQRPPAPVPLKHPAPLPPAPRNQPYSITWKQGPPRPALKISHTSSGIVLSWDMTLTTDFEKIGSYQLYAYQEGTAPPSPSLWREVGDVKALPLPMACTLSYFVPGHRYHFSVRAVDVHGRVGQFSFPGSILLNK